MKKPNQTIDELLSTGTHYLHEHGCGSARLDAELLLAALLKKNRTELLTKAEESLADEVCSRYQDFITQRGAAKPVAYLTGEKEFMSLNFKVNPDVLIPRPDTEIVVEHLLSRLRSRNGIIHGVDIGTGSGCIAISICHYLPNVQMAATDISAPAIRVAQENAKRLGVIERISFFQSELFSEFGFYKINQNSQDFIVSNPPYIPCSELNSLMADVLHEPRTALDGGESGLDFFQQLISGAPFYLKQGGLLALEIGAGQAEALKKIFAASGRYNAPEVYPDLQGHSRAIIAERIDG